MQAAAARTMRSRRKNQSASVVKSMAGISGCASKACAKKTGERHTMPAARNAGIPRASRRSSMARRSERSAAPAASKQHGAACGFGMEPGNAPHRGQIRGKSGRVDYRGDRVRYGRAAMEKIERRGNVVPSLIPKVGQVEPRNVGKQNDAGEQQEQESIGAGPDRTAFGRRP